MKQVIRIIGGKYRGKKFYFPEVEGLRPTPDRVRETLFNWLMKDIQDIRCLDAFAGSGALGLEAFSRGACSVFFIEQNKAAYKNLEKNIAEFNNPALKLFCQDSREFMKNTRERFDLIFLDPPYSSNLWSGCLHIIEQSNVLTDGGLLYMESPEAIMLDESFWETLQLKSAGQVFYGLFRKKSCVG